MARKDELGKPLGICRRLFSFLVRIFPLTRHRRVSQRRNDVSSGHKEETAHVKGDTSKADDSIEEDTGSQVDVIIYREGDLRLSPPSIYFMEPQEAETKSSSAQASVSGKPEVSRRAKGQDEIMKKKTERLAAEQTSIQDVVGERSKKARKKSVKVEGKKGASSVEREELRKNPSVGEEQEKAVEQKGPRPTEPEQRSLAGINEKSNEFIRKKKKAFDSFRKEGV